MSIKYSPEYPSDPRPEFMWREFQRIGEAIGEGDVIYMEPTYVEPNKPREGEIRYADGTSWNPGLGKGLYLYDGEIWRPFG